MRSTAPGFAKPSVVADKLPRKWVSSRALSATGGGALPSTAFLVGAYLDVASAAVLEMGGKVAKKLGDGLMALFGYPVAQENDAERAVRAAAGDPAGAVRAEREERWHGQTDAGSSHCNRFRAGGAGCIGRNIRRRAKHRGQGAGAGRTGRGRGHGAGARQIPGLFVAEERGSHELKGVPEPVTLFRPVRASGGGRRSGQRHLTPLVGRDVAAQRQRSRDHQRVRGGGPRHPPILGEDDFEGLSLSETQTRPY
jgi:hypothetical protein